MPLELLEFSDKAVGDNDRRFAVDFTNALAEDEYILDVLSVTANPTNAIEIYDTARTGKVVSFRVVGGIADVKYILTVAISTNLAPRLERSVVLPVKQVV